MTSYGGFALEIVSGIKQSSRGKGKGVAWQVELDLPALAGTLDAKIFAASASSEIVDRIRERWSRGYSLRDAGGSLSQEGKAIRRAMREILIGSGDYDEYQKKIRLLEESMAGTSGARWLRLVQVRKERWAKYKRIVMKRYQARVPDGEIGKKSVKRQYVPNEDDRPIMASGLMHDTLRGKYRRGRSWVAPSGRRMQANSHVELRIPKNRQYAAKWVGGLTGADVDAVTQTFAHMPQTKALARNCVKWKRAGDSVATAWQTLRLVYKITRLLGRI